MKPISLEEMKQIQVDILKDVHLFCEKNNIRYTLIYGSLLGAVRHKGYIPWDDDIDIAMLRDDYEKFVASYKSENGFYRVYDCRKDNGYYYPFLKVADTRTVLEENVSMQNIGVNIDIFPCDYLFDTKQECINFIKKLDFLKKLFRIKLVKPGKKNSFIKRILIRVLKLLCLPISMKNIVDREYALVNRLTNRNAKFVGFAFSSDLSCSYRSICPREVFEKYEKVPFEKETFEIISSYDEWLTQMFGDYMTPPPAKERTSPHTLNNVYWK
ncbi:lipopolysaccharide cholinephosphotransferase [Fibrobacter sp. UWR3]|uniref:LicD family protein n=1 Tax=Fibrobacter sp. UWR3 TaxID=1896217 RepID=UPI00091D5961|nr:LicD family protein [Fibrobacter sp. UWR3]SHM26136.1 lipopolysaccharide cholinephosphotransferase [Fibrobacter sp. UWR3]